MQEINFVEVTEDNAVDEGLFCIKNPKNPGFGLKLAWLEERRKEGLRLVQLKVSGETAGFIEFVPGEFAWRPVEAKEYLFIHCMWVYPKKHYSKGYGSRLIDHCLEQARDGNFRGVAVVVSKGSWMAGRELFEKNGFKTADTKGRFELMVYKLQDSANPRFFPFENNLTTFKGLNLVYANQCPLFVKSIEELKQTAREFGHELKITVIDSAEKAQQSPSGYGVYSLIYNGKLLSDHYISNTRFKNILTKELGN